METIPNIASYKDRVPERPSLLGFTTGDGKDAWWEGQQETIGRVLEGLKQADVVVMSAPPGSGKTLMGAAVSRLYAPSITCTHTIALQQQYQRTAPWASTNMGKSNFECGHKERRSKYPQLAQFEDSFTVEQCDDYLDCIDPWRYGCEYFRNIGDAADNDLVVLNYAYALPIVQTKNMKSGVCVDEDHEAQPNPFRRQLAILDECHLADQAIVAASALEFWHGTLKKVGIPRPLDTATVSDWQQWTIGALNLLSKYDDDDEFDLVMRARRRALVERLGVLQKIRAEDWIIRREDSVTRIQPLWSRSVYGRFLAYYPKIILMSATPGDPNLLVERLGLEDRSARYISVPSTFPVSNRPTFYWPVVKLSARSEEDDYDRLASAVQYIADQPRIAALKGIIHTPSYKLVTKLRQHLTKDGNETIYIFHEEAAHKSSCVKLFEEADYPLILVTPSLSTGFDLPYQIGFQIIAKVPFADLGDPIVKARREYQLGADTKFGQRCYQDDALNQVVQAVGRAVRAPDDSGVSYILDENFWPLFKRSFSPDHFKETILWL